MEKRPLITNRYIPIQTLIYDVITISSETSMLVAFISLEHTGKSVNNMFSNGEAKFIQFIYLGIIDLFNVF